MLEDLKAQVCQANIDLGPSGLVKLTWGNVSGIDRDKGIFMAAGSYGDLAVVLPDAAAEPLANRFLERFNIQRTFVIKPEPLFQAWSRLSSVTSW